MSSSINPRDEAERLVAAALASLSVAVQGTRGFATGSAECCVCPVCRAIAALRDPSPQFAERLASGAGDLATGLAGVLRAFGAATGGAPAAPRSDATTGRAESDRVPSGGGRRGSTPGSDGDVWSAATRIPGQSEPAAPPQPPTSTPQPLATTPMAKKAVKPMDKNVTTPTATTPTATTPMAKKAVKPMAKKAVAPKKATPPAASPQPDHGDEGAVGQWD